MSLSILIKAANCLHHLSQTDKAYLVAMTQPCWTELHLSFLLLEDPDLVPAVGQFEGTVIASHVERFVNKRHVVSLQAFNQLLELLALHFLIGEATVCPWKKGTTRSLVLKSMDSPQTVPTD